jgi:hypothetical protein
VVKWLTFLLHILDVWISNLGAESGYPDRFFYDFSQSLQANARIVP